MKRLQNKIAVITGGSSGIGQGIAKQFLAEGAKVVIFGRDLEKLTENKRMLGDVLTVQGDVTQTADLKKLYETCLAHYGKIDTLVVNSGVSERIHINDASEEKFDHMVDINFRGAYFTVRYAVDFLNEKASVIMIASAAAHLTFKSHTIYSATKTAVMKLAKNLSYDLADRMIRVNSISPGYIKTPIFDSRLEKDPDYLLRKMPNIPLKRVGEPKDVAHAAVFLASDEASYITGSDLLVDGGYSASFPAES